MKPSQAQQQSKWVPWVAGAVVTALVLLLARAGSQEGGILQENQLLQKLPAAAAPAAAAVAQAASWLGGGAAGGPNPNPQLSAAYVAEAGANLTRWKTSFMSTLLADFGLFSKDTWPRFKPVISCPPDRPLTKYGGDGDGTKYLCKLHEGTAAREGCIIYSMGSAGLFQFEQAMLKETSCEIHTFDCRYDGKDLDPRHKYHKWCIGNGASQQGYRTWDNVTQTLGHTKVDLLKIDIEGHEYPVLASFQPDMTLPLEIAIEFHYTYPSWQTSPTSATSLAFVFLHMANLGYATYSQEVNALAPHCCSEFTFMRISRHGCDG